MKLHHAGCNSSVPIHVIKIIIECLSSAEKYQLYLLVSKYSNTPFRDKSYLISSSISYSMLLPDQLLYLFSRPLRLWYIYIMYGEKLQRFSIHILEASPECQAGTPCLFIHISSFPFLCRAPKIFLEGGHDLACFQNLAIVIPPTCTIWTMSLNRFIWLVLAEN